MIQCVCNKMCFKLVILLIMCELARSSIEDGFTVNGREKRTIDLFLRGVADAFGYDILKRPTVLPPVTTTPVMVVSTYPPPLAPFAPRQRPKPQQPPLPPTPQQPPLPPKPQQPPLPPKPQQPPVPPRTQPQPLPSPSPKPVAPLPKAPPQPPTPSPSRMPLPPPSAAPPPPAPPAPTRLIETIRKTFNLNFNWNKNLQPQPSNTTSPSPPQVPATTQKSAPMPTMTIAATTIPPTLQNAGGQQFLHKPQLYEEYDYLDKEEFKRNEKEPKMTLGEEIEKQSNPQNSIIHDDKGNNSNQAAKTEPNKNSNEQKMRFQESVNEFWKNYPFTEQEGYKYIGLPDQPVLTNVPNNHFKTDEQSLNEDTDNSDEYETKAYFYFLPRNYAVFNGDGPHRFSLNKEVEQVPRNIKKSERFSKQSEMMDKNSSEKEMSESIAHPLFSGVLPIQLHHLVKEEGSLKPWSSVPYYDYEYGATENKHSYAPKEGVPIMRRTDILNGYECCGTVITNDNFEYYTVPEPEPIDYSKYEMLHVDTDKSDKLSKNAKIKTKQNTTTVIKANNYKNSLKY